MIVRGACTVAAREPQRCKEPVTYSDKDGDWCDGHGRARHGVRQGLKFGERCQGRHCRARAEVRQRRGSESPAPVDTKSEG